MLNWRGGGSIAELCSARLFHSRNRPRGDYGADSHLGRKLSRVHVNFLSPLTRLQVNGIICLIENKN